METSATGSTEPGASTAPFEIDLTAITTNDTRRDRKVHEALETSAFPTATFVLRAPVELGRDATTGTVLKAEAAGDLTIHGVTKAVTFPLEAKLVEGTIVVVGSLGVTFSDFGVQMPSSPIVLAADDAGTIELQVLLTRRA